MVLGDIPALREAFKKLSVQMLRPAVEADIRWRGFDAALLDSSLDAAIPEALEEKAA